MKNILEKLFTAADNHGEDSGETDHTVGDLQGLLRHAWELMSVSQKLKLLDSEVVADLVEAGAQGDFEAGDLIAALKQGQPVALTESELADFMLQRIEDGALALGDIPARLAQYGLMEHEAFVDEMRERIESAKG